MVKQAPASQPENQTLIIFTDGGARGNPGRAGIGIVFKIEAQGASGELQTQTIAKIKKYIGEHTNNFAEYAALIAALEKAAELGYSRAQCHLDSELVVRQLNGQYKIKEPNIKLLAQRALALAGKFKSITFSHVPREKNSEADALVNQALDESFIA